MATSQAELMVRIRANATEFNQAFNQAGAKVQQFDGQMTRLGTQSRINAGAFQNLGFQIQDYAIQTGNGTSATQALSQQLPQLLSGFGLVGVAAGVLVAAGIPLARMFFDTKTAVIDADEAFNTFSASLGSVETYAALAGRSMSSLREEFGQFADEVRAEAESLLRINIAALATSAADPAGAIGAQVDAVTAAYDRWMDALVGLEAQEKQFGANAGQRAAVDQMRVEFEAAAAAVGLTGDGFRILRGLLGDLSNASDQDLGTILANLTGIQGVLQAMIEGGGSTPELVSLFNQVNGEVNRLRALSVDVAAEVAGIAGFDLASPFRDAADEAERLAQGILFANRYAASLSLDDGRGSQRGVMGGAGIARAGREADQRSAVGMIRGFEGYRDQAYWDVNHWRVGYGSDTHTAADGSSRAVQQGDTTTREAADRDLARRIGEFQGGIIRAIGGIDRWNEFNEQQQAALTSVAYNYGSLSRAGIAGTVATGSTEDIAAAIRGLASHNDGINAGRRNQEAAAFLGESGETSRVAAATREAEAAARASAAAQDASARATEAQREAYERLTGSLDPVLAANQAFAAGQAVVTAELNAGRISADEAAWALERLGVQRDEALAAIEAPMTAMQETIAGMSGTISGGISAELKDLVTGAQTAGEAFQDMGGTILGTIADIMAQRFTERFITPMIDGLLGTIMPGMLGGGMPGIGGGAPPLTAIPGLATATMAQGWDSAAMVDPVGTLAPGLAVATSAQADDAAFAQTLAGAARSAPIQVVVNNTASDQVTATPTMDSSGGMDVLTLVVQRVKGDLSRDVRRGGDFAGALEGTYGLPRRGRA